MLRVVFTVIWSLLSVWLLIWVGEGLFAIDQTTSILPLRGDDNQTAPLMVGVAWASMLTFGVPVGFLLRRSTPRGTTQVAVGTVLEATPTGLSINDVPQYDIFLRVSTTDGTEFVSQLRMLLRPADEAMIAEGTPLGVRYSPSDFDRVSLADMSDPAVRAAVLDWRVEKGLIAPDLVAARKTGIEVPASVLEVRPTGRRREGQSELALRVLMTPEGESDWEADTTLYVYPEAIPRLQVGAPLWARYLRHDPGRVAVMLEREAA